MELRIHGVSGTAPELMLQHPRLRRVAGNRLAGFHRREWESKASRDDDTAPVLEAYWWGGLTSGNWSRALWLLLLPFMLVNVAFYMGPLPALEKQDAAGHYSWWRVRGLSESVQRLLALSLTFTMVLAVCGVTMDLVAWQCFASGTECALQSWTQFLRWPWLQPPGRRIAVMAIVPLAVVGVLWWLGRSTWASTERAKIDTGVEPTVDIKIAERSLWNGQRRVRRLRVLHIGAALALVGLLLTVPFLSGGELTAHDMRLPASQDTLGRWFAAVLAWVFVGLVALCAVAVARDPTPKRKGIMDRGGGSRLLTSVVFVCLAAAMVQASASDVRAGGRTYPWMTDGPRGLFMAQLLLLAVLLLSCVVLRLRTGRASDEKVLKAAQLEQPSTAAWFGLAQPAIAGIGWLMANAFAAALLLRMAEVLGTPQPSSGPHRPGRTALFLPPALFWAAATTAVALAAALVCAFLGYRQKRHVNCEDDVLEAYGKGRVNLSDLEVRDRVKQVRRDWELATIADVARTWVGRWMLVSLVLVGAAFVLFWVSPNWIFDHYRGAFAKLIAAGSLALTGGITAHVFLGWRAYRSDSTRRIAGIIWDIGTFWPRATHPLAPPCYSERTIPDLIKRIEDVTQTGHNVYLSAHSQGAVIAASTVAALRADCVSRVGLLTYGSPAARLYARFFPAYFSTPSLLALGDHLLGRKQSVSGLVDRVRPQDRSRWPWLNLYRKSDLIGGWVLVDYAAVEAGTDVMFGQDADDVLHETDLGQRATKRRAYWTSKYTKEGHFTAGVFENGDVDWQFIDPRFDRAVGDREFPATLGHSDYWHDPAFKEAMRLLMERRAMSTASTAGQDDRLSEGGRPNEGSHE